MIGSSLCRSPDSLLFCCKPWNQRYKFLLKKDSLFLFLILPASFFQLRYAYFYRHLCQIITGILKLKPFFQSLPDFLVIHFFTVPVFHHLLTYLQVCHIHDLILNKI